MKVYDAVLSSFCRRAIDSVPADIDRKKIYDKKTGTKKA
jgi:hypothetical protein